MTTAGPVALVVFTRDLRVADNPALTAAARASTVVCAFVHDDALRSGRPMHRLRIRFLTDCLADLDASLRCLGSRLPSAGATGSTRSSGSRQGPGRQLDSATIHEPWHLGRRELDRLGYPAPIVSVGGTA